MIIVLYRERSWAEAPTSKGQIQCFNVQVQKQSRSAIRNEAGPQAQLQNGKSNARKPKSTNNISLWAARFYEELASRNSAIARLFPPLSRDSKTICPTSHRPSSETKWIVIKNEAGRQAQLQKDKSTAFSLRMKPGRRPGFRMKARLHSSGRSGSLGGTRRIRQVRGGRTSRAGRARANRAGRGGPGGQGLEQYY